MTHDQKLQAVKQYIQKCCPEVMDLKFGCKILCKKDNRCFIGGRKCINCRDNTRGICLCIKESGRVKENIGTIVGKIKDGGFYCISINTNSVWRTTKEPPEKIIGTPIGLPEVLRTYQKTIQVVMDEDFPDVIFLCAKEDDGEWNLLLTLDEQPEETISFLYSITPKE